MTPAELKNALPLKDDEHAAIYKKLRHKGGLAFISKTELTQRLSILQENGIAIDGNVLLTLILQVEWVNPRICKDVNLNPSIENGCEVYELLETGCRVRFESQEHLAREIDVSVSHFKHQIGLLKFIDIVVATGHGWIEFDAQIVWQGNLELRDHYIDWQKANLPSLQPFVFVE